MKKKILSLILVTLMITTLTGCNNNNPTAKDEGLSEDNTTETVVNQTETEVTDAENDEDNVVATYWEDAEVDRYDVLDIASIGIKENGIESVSHITTGINDIYEQDDIFYLDLDIMDVGVVYKGEKADKDKEAFKAIFNDASDIDKETLLYWIKADVKCAREAGMDIEFDLDEGIYEATDIEFYSVIDGRKLDLTADKDNIIKTARTIDNLISNLKEECEDIPFASEFDGMQCSFSSGDFSPFNTDIIDRETLEDAGYWVLCEDYSTDFEADCIIIGKGDLFGSYELYKLYRVYDESIEEYFFKAK